ncbi:uncharacterized protein V6R79_008443 [Siganus canaliculatus]
MSLFTRLLRRKRLFGRQMSGQVFVCIMQSDVCVLTLETFLCKRFLFISLPRSLSSQIRAAASPEDVAGRQTARSRDARAANTLLFLQANGTAVSSEHVVQKKQAGCEGLCEFTMRGNNEAKREKKEEDSGHVQIATAFVTVRLVPTLFPTSAVELMTHYSSDTATDSEERRCPPAQNLH